MLPVLLRVELWGSTLRLGAFAFLVFCGVLAATLIVLRRANEARLSPRDLLPIFAGCIVTGFLGARLGSWLQTGGGGLVLYGGLLTGMATGLLLARARGLPALDVADLAAPAVLLAAAFGRVGCVLAGCCYGVICDGGLSYPPGSHPFRDQVHRGLLSPTAAASLPTAPVTLLEAVVLFSLFVVTSLIWKRRSKSGSVLAVSGLVYASWRFVAEFRRADNHAWWAGGLTFSQGISVAVAILGAALLLRKRAPPASAPIPFRPATALQVLAVLASVGLSLTSINCSTHDKREKTGVQVYRQPAGGSSVSPTRPPLPPADPFAEEDDDDGFFDDCFSDCVDVCTEACTEACIEACVEAICKDSCSSSGTEPEPGTTAESVLGKLTPGTKYRGTLGFEALVNKRLAVLLKLEGSVTVGRKTAGGVWPVHLRARKASLKIGEARWTGSGDLDLVSGPGLELRLVTSTLPPEFMDALATLNGLTGNLLRGLATDHPIADLASVVQEELRSKDPSAEFSMATTFEGQERWLLGDANVVEDPPGTYRLAWRIKD